MRPVLAIAAAAVVAAVAAALILGTRSEPRLAGTNGVDAGSFSLVLASGEEYCVSGQFIPGGADRLRMTIGSYDRPIPPIHLRIIDETRRVLVGRRVPAPPAQGVVTLPLGRTTDEPLRDATVCVTPHGRRIALGGFNDDARIEWLRPGSESYFELAGTILHRFGVGKPGWTGGWTLVVALLLAAGVWGATIRLILRESPS